MLLRGAPLIGVAAAFAFALAMKEKEIKNIRELSQYAETVKKALTSTRPTAKNLFWAVDRVYGFIEKMIREGKNVTQISAEVEKLAKSIYDEDIKVNLKISENGKGLFKRNSTIMTHCNAGALATAGYGTALGVIRAAYKDGRVKKVYVNETRPYLQGARLTMLELMYEKIPCELITDNMAGYVMKNGKVDAVIVGADRIARNGDVANKIGTYQLAILADYHKIPFYVAAPTSTIDRSVATGKNIPIEHRNEDEVKKIFGKYITLKNAKALHPAFDVTPAELVSAIITEEKVFKYPYNF